MAPIEPPRIDGPTTTRTTIRRHRDRGSYDRSLMFAILDEALVCHVGFVSEHGPLVLPMAHVRIGDSLYLHGALANAMLRTLIEGGDACVTVTLLDGTVLARSAFHHSMNYRCVTVFGSATRVTDHDEIIKVSRALVDHVAPGRSGDMREPSVAEIRKTLFLRLPISEVSAKVRSGGPIDEPEDYGLPVWAGAVPLVLTRGKPVADDGVDIPLPDYLAS